MSVLREFEFHPLAEMFPLIEGPEYEELRASVKTMGIINRVTLYQGKVLDGRNRVRAAVAEGVSDIPTYNLPEEIDPVAFVISQNIMRRHLAARDRARLTVRAMAYSGELAKKKEEAKARPQGEKRPASTDTARVREVVAARAGVSPATAQRALDEHRDDPKTFEEETAEILVRARSIPRPHPVVKKKKKLHVVRKGARYMTKAPNSPTRLAAFLRQKWTTKAIAELVALLVKP